MRETEKSESKKKREDIREENNQNWKRRESKEKKGVRKKIEGEKKKTKG